VPLKKNDLFKGAIPSKLFEPLAMGKPILLGVDGEAKKIFIEDGNCGIAFEPENEIQLAKGIQLVLDDKTLLSELGANGKKYILQNFDRKVINQDFYKRIKLI
jgi:glycosyltransferase involved in cell wall biosynthesis